MDAQLTDENRRLRTGVKPAFVDATDSIARQDEDDEFPWLAEIDFTRPAPGTHLGEYLGEVVGTAPADDQPAPAV